MAEEKKVNQTTLLYITRILQGPQQAESKGT